MELPVPVQLAVAYLVLEVKDEHLIALRLAPGGGDHLDPGNGGLPDGNVIAISDHKYPIQLNGSTFGHRQAFHLNGLPRAHLVLFTTRFYYRVNRIPPQKSYKLTF